jgi:hypothetical protein
MNPEFFCNQSDTLQTLEHEMTHLRQHHFAQPSRRTYHNAQWVSKMESFGLMPSSTGAPGSTRTGQPGGRFLAECERLLRSNFRISFGDRVAKTVTRSELEIQVKSGGEGQEVDFAPPSIELSRPPISSSHTIAYASKRPGADRVKFRCAACEMNAWAKPSAHLVCSHCGQSLECV